MGQESVCKKVKMLVYKYLGTYLVWAHGISSGCMVRSPVSSATPLARLTSGWCGVIRVSNSSRALDWFGLDRKSSDETGEEKLLDRAERQYCIARGLALCSAHEVKSTAAMIYTSHLGCCKLIVQGERSTRRLHQPL